MQGRKIFAVVWLSLLSDHREVCSVGEECNAVCLFLQIETEYSFLDYVMGGCQINFTVSCFPTAPLGRGQGKSDNVVISASVCSTSDLQMQCE